MARRRWGRGPLWTKTEAAVLIFWAWLHLFIFYFPDQVEAIGNFLCGIRP
jgi:hypothetical protein